MQDVASLYFMNVVCLNQKCAYCILAVVPINIEPSGVAWLDLSPVAKGKGLNTPL